MKAGLRNISYQEDGLSVRAKTETQLCQEDEATGKKEGDEVLTARATTHPRQRDGGTRTRGADERRAGATTNPSRMDGGTGTRGADEVRAGATTHPGQRDGGREDEIATELLRKQSRAVKAGRHGRVENLFKMREEIEGSKRKVQEPNAIKDPKTGEIIVS